MKNRSSSCAMPEAAKGQSLQLPVLFVMPRHRTKVPSFPCARYSGFVLERPETEKEKNGCLQCS